MSDLLPVDEAIARILAGATAIGTEAVALGEASGRFLAAPLAARRTQPPFAASSMDGYAVRAEDVAAAGARLTVVGLAAAGQAFHGRVGPRQTARIFTGAPVPEGADAVLVQENVEAIDDTAVVARQAARPGQNIRPAGLDFAEGAVLLEPGRRLAMRELALAAAMGFGAVPVRRRPRVAIVATGDELVPTGAVPGPDQIVASTGFGLAALVEAAGGVAVDLGIVPDDHARIVDAVDRALALPADVLVTLGGASVGDHDLIRDGLAAKGMELDFWKIAMRPGKPLVFGRLPRSSRGTAMRVLGLPGNPVSSLVCALLFLKPLIGALLGLPPADPTTPACLGAGLPANDRRQDYLRATLAETPGELPVATALPVQDSSMLAVLAKADCLIVRPPLAPAARAGEPCRIIRLP
jgi:molybdopterin molybdotransferase